MPKGHLIGIALAILGFLIEGADLAGPTEYLSTKDASRILNRLKEIQNDAESDPKQIFLTTASLKQLGEKIQTKKICKSIAGVVSDKSLSDLYYAVNAGCKLKMTSVRISTVQGGLDSGVIADALMATTIATKLSAEDKFNFDTLNASIADLKQVDGTFKASLDAPRADAASTAFAIHIGTMLGVEQVSGSSVSLLKMGKARGDLYFTSPKRNRLITTALVLETAVQAGDVTKDHISRIASFLVKNKHVREAEDIYYLLLALSICSTNPVHVPLVLTVVDGVAQVSDVLGKPYREAKVSVVRVTNHLTKAEIEGVKISKGGKLAISPGIYDVTFEVTPPTDKKYLKQTATREVIITTAVPPKSVAMYIAKSGKLSGGETKHTAKFPGSVTEELLVDESEHYLHLRLGLSKEKEGVAPEQVFVEFKHADSGHSAVFAMSHAGNVYSFKLNLGSSEFTEKSAGPGMYVLNVFVGGVLLEKSLIWKLADLKITWPPSSKSDTPIEKLKAKPEIRHIFREPDREPNVLISLFFTIAVLAPMVIVFYGIEHLGLKVEFPSNGQLWATGFMGSLGAFVLLNLLYFLFLNIFQALALLSIVSVAAVATGHKALNFLNSVRRKSKSA